MVPGVGYFGISGSGANLEFQAELAVIRRFQGRIHNLHIRSLDNHPTIITIVAVFGEAHIIGQVDEVAKLIWVTARFLSDYKVG